MIMNFLYNQSLMNFLKDYLPPILIRKITGFFYGWHGNYKSWTEAKKHSLGYDSDYILNKVKDALLKVKNGEAVSERDSVIFDKIEYSFPVLSAILWIAIQNRGNLNIIDFGGSLGSSYFQNKKFLNSLSKVNWNIVEQNKFVECGQKYFQNEQLKFFETIDECIHSQQPYAILLSSVLPYIEKPYELLDSILKQNFRYIIFDRTPFVPSKEERLTIQKVHPAIYHGSYPCWFFNEEKFLEKFKERYELITDFYSSDRANIKSVFKGFLFRLKN